MTAVFSLTPSTPFLRRLRRLDVESKLSDQLRLAYLRCREDERSLVLLHLLRQVVPAGQQTVVFAATKHHVEYIRLVSRRGDRRRGSGYSNRFPPKAYPI